MSITFNPDKDSINSSTEKNLGKNIGLSILAAIYDFKKTIDLLLGNTIAIPSMESGNFSNNLSAMDSKNEVIPYALIFWSLYIPGISLY